MSQPNPISNTADREISLTRIIDAPRELVFAAWSDPVQISNWWGPRGFTTTTSIMEFRPGGTWRFVMHGPDGIDYSNKIIYRQLVEPELIVYDHSGDGENNKVNFHTTVILVEKGNKTEMTFRMLFPTKEERDRVVDEFGAIEGLQHTLARLNEHLTGVKS